MLSNSERASLKRQLKRTLADPRVLDAILFGSARKGKPVPGDYDVALLTSTPAFEAPETPGIHSSIVPLQDFFVNPPTIVTTLVREGYSLKHDAAFAERWRFSPRVLYTYELTRKTNSEKASIVRFLRGDFLAARGGAWIARQVFTIPLDADWEVETFFKNKGIAFTKRHILLH
jgi:hypothetical protein